MAECSGMSRYDELVEHLLRKLAPGFGGSSRPTFVTEIGTLTREIERVSGSYDYVQEKACSVREWVAIACSPRRHAKWGLERVELFAYQDAYRLIGAYRG